MKRLILLTLLLVCISGTIKAKAGFISGDEPLGGFSYMMDCAIKNKVPDKEPYRSLFYEAYMKYHYDYLVTKEEREILERIVEAEATGGTVAQKMNVASCILARVESDNWPNDIKSVVFDHYNGVWQFSPLGDGRYYTVPITDGTRHAVESVLKNGKTTDCLWFCSDGSYTSGHSWHKTHCIYHFFDGMHHYFY